MSGSGEGVLFLTASLLPGFTATTGGTGVGGTFLVNQMKIFSQSLILIKESVEENEKFN